MALASFPGECESFGFQCSCSRQFVLLAIPFSYFLYFLKTMEEPPELMGRPNVRLSFLPFLGLLGMQGEHLKRMS